MKTRNYVYAISTDSLFAAVAEAEEILSDLLEETLRNGSEPEARTTIELQSALGRHRETRQHWANIDELDLDTDDGGEVGLFE